MTNPITINKLNLQREIVWSYTGEILERAPHYIRLEARFNRDTLDLGYTTFERSDRFVEHFFADRWYNIFEIHSVHDNHLKGWYCNIVEPAVFGDRTIGQVDLALDVWINPDGSHLILDQDEFDALPLTAAARQQAQHAVQELLERLAQRAAPFNTIA